MLSELSSFDVATELSAWARSCGFDLKLVIEFNSSSELIVVSTLMRPEFLGARRHDIICWRSIVPSLKGLAGRLDFNVMRVLLEDLFCPWLSDVALMHGLYGNTVIDGGISGGQGSLSLRGRHYFMSMTEELGDVYERICDDDENDDRGGSVKCKQIDMYSKL